jgi:hypothetical protein
MSNAKRRIAAFAAVLAMLGAILGIAGAPAQASYNADYDYWTGHGDAVTYVRGYSSCSPSQLRVWCKAYDVTSYTRDDGATYSRVEGTVDLAAVNGELTVGWPPSISFTESSYRCSFTDAKHRDTDAKRSHSGMVCRVESYISVGRDDMSATGTHWRGSYTEAHTAWVSI